MKNISLRPLLLPILLFLAALIYAPSFRAPFQFDDLLVITQNRVIQNPLDLATLWQYDPSRFITHLTFGLNFAWGGLEVLGYHGINFLIHLLNVFLVFMLASLLCEQLCPNINGMVKSGAVYAALIFLVHPIQTSAVTYIAQRSTLLAAFFYLSTLILYILYRQGKGRIYFLTAVLANIMGLFCKPIIVTLPLALILVEIFIIEDKAQGFIKRAQSLLMFLVLSLCVPMLLMLWRHKGFDPHYILDSTRETSAFSRHDYFLTQLNVLVTYLRLLVFPVNQNLDYDYPIATQLLAWPTLGSALIVGLLMCWAVKAYKRFKLLSFAIVWYFVTLSLESSIFPIADVIFEHRLYLAMLAFALTVPWAIFNFVKKQSLANVLMVVIISVFSVMTFNRNTVWSDRIGMLKDIVAKSPNKTRTYMNLARAYFDEKDYDQAITAYSRILELDPKYAKIYLYRGLTYYIKGDLAKALADYNQSITLNPDVAEAYYDRAVVFIKTNKLNLALADLNKAIILEPSNENAYFVRAKVQALNGHWADASEDYATAVRIDPNFSKAQTQLGIAYYQDKKFAKAVEAFGLALKLAPTDGNIYFYRSVAYRAVGDLDKARQDAVEARSRGVSINAKYLKGLNLE